MQSGRLRHTITINETTVASQNSYGEDVLTTAEVGQYPCLVEYLEGRELGSAMQRWAKARYKITMRHQPGTSFNPKMSITWEGRTLDILDVQDPADNTRPRIIITAQDHES